MSKQQTDVIDTDANTRIVELDEPIVRGETQITTLSIRKPRAGELRGLSLGNLAEMDVTTLTRLLPRVTTPSITEAEAAALDLADLASCGQAVSAFLLKRALRESLRT